jgi:hypothetical protein
MRSFALKGASLWFLIVGLSGCASLPCKTGGEQAQTMDELVVIFQDEKKFEAFMDGRRSATGGGEASAIVGQAGAAGGAGSGDLPGDRGYSTHLITDAGVPAMVTVAVIRVKPAKLKEQRCLGTSVPPVQNF